MSASPAPSGPGPGLLPCPVWSDVQEIRRRSHLVLNITDFVVMNLTANALLALGASPGMAHATEELDEMIDLAQALVINLGTLSRDWIEAMERAVIAAGRRGIELATGKSAGPGTFVPHFLDTPYALDEPPWHHASR